MAISTSGVSAGYFRNIAPLNNIQPFTFRDSLTYQELLYSYEKWINQIHLPELANELTNIVEQLNAALTANAGTFENGVAEFQRIHDAFMADVNASIIALTDPQIKALIENATSLTGAKLRELFATRDELTTTLNTVQTKLDEQSTTVQSQLDAQSTSITNQMNTLDGDLRALVAANGGAIRASDYGVIGDGVADDTVKLRAAITAANAQGRLLQLKPGSIVKITDRIVWKENTHVDGQGATILATGVDSSLFSLDFYQVNNVSLRNVVLRVDAGNSLDKRGIRFYRVNRGVIDNVVVESTVPGTGNANGYMNALYCADSKFITVSNSLFKNFDYCTQFDIVSNLTVHNVVVECFRTGMWVKNVTDSNITNYRCSVSSPNAGALPGHNGVLVECSDHDLTRNVHFDNVRIRDAGEHGFRLGGQKRISNLSVTNSSVENVGLSGFKILGGTLENGSYHEDILLENCSVVDAGNQNTNAAAFMIQMSKRVTVTNPTIKPLLKQYAAGEGFNVQGVDAVQIINPYCLNVMNAGVMIDDNLGGVTEVVVDGGYFSSLTGHGIVVNYTDIAIRRLRVINHPELQHSAGYAFRIVNTGTGTFSGVSTVSCYIPTTSYGVIDPASNTSRIVASIHAAYEPGVNTDQFYAGSEWVDLRTSGNLGRAVKSGGVWKWL